MAEREGNDRGAVLLEFALVVPILILLVVGIIEFGRAYNVQVSIQAAAREGARELALRKSAGEVEAAVRSAAPSVDIDAISQSGCPATGDGQASVTVSEAYTFRIPFIPVATKTLTATGVMRCGL